MHHLSHQKFLHLPLFLFKFQICLTIWYLSASRLPITHLYFQQFSYWFPCFGSVESFSFLMIQSIIFLLFSTVSIRLLMAGLPYRSWGPSSHSSCCSLSSSRWHRDTPHPPTGPFLCEWNMFQFVCLDLNFLIGVFSETKILIPSSLFVFWCASSSLRWLISLIPSKPPIVLRFFWTTFSHFSSI